MLLGLGARALVLHDAPGESALASGEGGLSHENEDSGECGSDHEPSQPRQVSATPSFAVTNRSLGASPTELAVLATVFRIFFLTRTALWGLGSSLSGLFGLLRASRSPLAVLPED